MRSIHTRIAQQTAPTMFALAVLFLACQAILIVLWVDVPSLREMTVGRQDTRTIELDAFWLPVTQRSPIAAALERWAVLTMLVIWPIVGMEAIYHLLTRPRETRWRWHRLASLAFLVCPSLRMGARSPEMNDKIWLPGMQWRRPDARLRRRLAKRFSVPMVGIALLILPVLIVEFFMKEQVARYLWLRVALHVSTGIIWFAFAAEFILMVSIAEKKWDYLKENWIDLTIIALPFFSFLRSLQAVRGTKLAKLAKVSQITKLVRAYRLRGTALKAFRALILLDVLTRLIRTSPEQQLIRYRTKLEAAERDTRLLRLIIARLQRQIREQNSEPDVVAEEDEQQSPPPQHRVDPTPQSRQGTERLDDQGNAKEKSDQNSATVPKTASSYPARREA